MKTRKNISAKLIALLFTSFVFQPFAFEAQENDTEEGGEQIDTQLSEFRGRTITEPTNDYLAISGPLTASLMSGNYSYRAVTNRTLIEDSDNVFPPAHIVSTSYEVIGDFDRATRPVVFAFNGGPGSSSAWLHLGAWGPERLVSPGSPEVYFPPPYKLEQNKAFLIDVADVVFVDPVGTGLSRIVDNTAHPATAFADTRTDARSMCRFVENWLKAEDRWGAPVYLAGESYGAIRIAGIVSHSNCRELRPHLNGLVFLSGLLDLRARGQGLLSNVSKFPTWAALAWYHELVDRTQWNNDFDAFLSAAKTTASSDYASALFFGNGISPERERNALRQLGPFLGLNDEDLPSTSLAQLESIFKHKFKEEVGGRPAQYDGRYVVPIDQYGRGSSLPPLNWQELSAVFERKINESVLASAGFDFEDKYLVFSEFGYIAHWDYRFLKSQEGGRGTNLADILSRVIPTSRRTEPTRDDNTASDEVKARSAVAALGLPPDFKMLVLAGLHDEVTPFMAMEMALQQANIRPDVYEVHLYEGGHMMYLDKGVAEQLADNIRQLVMTTN